MLKLESIAAYVAVVDARSITEAARRLGLAKSVISERLGQLERELGTRLLQRSTRKLSLTADGEAFLIRARRIVAETTLAASELAERRGALVGPLRISAPVMFGTLHLGRVLCEFVAEHPEIELSLQLEDQFVDIASDGYDAVVRHGPVPSQGAVVKRLAVSQRVLVASPAYLKRHGTPRAVHELVAHRGILYNLREPDWCFRTGGRFTVVRPTRSYRVNNGLVMRDAAVTGLGIALLPEFAVYREIASGELTQITLDVEPESAEIFLAYHADRGNSAKLRALGTWLRRAMGTPPYWHRASGRKKP